MLEAQLGQPLADLSVEAGKVELIELAELGPVGQVHHPSSPCADTTL